MSLLLRHQLNSFTQAEELSSNLLHWFLFHKWFEEMCVCLFFIAISIDFSNFLKWQCTISHSLEHDFLVTVRAFFLYIVFFFFFIFFAWNSDESTIRALTQSVHILFIPCTSTLNTIGNYVKIVCYTRSLRLFVFTVTVRCFHIILLVLLFVLFSSVHLFRSAYTLLWTAKKRKKRKKRNEEEISRNLNVGNMKPVFRP